MGDIKIQKNWEFRSGAWKWNLRKDDNGEPANGAIVSRGTDLESMPNGAMETC